MINSTVSLKPTAAGAKAPYTWSAAGLPAGLSINASTGAITGSPTAAGTYTAQVTATDASKIPGTTSLLFGIAATAFAVSNPGTQQGTTNVAATKLALSATGGNGPYTWAASGLPAGLSIDANSGWITGTPTSAGNSTVAVTATDSVKRTSSTTFSWVNAAAPAVANPGAQITVLNTAVSKSMSATGGTAPYSWTATGLPSGLSISTAGVISGTPTTVGAYQVSVIASDSTKRTGTATFTWTVATTPQVVDPGEQIGATNAPTTVTMAAKNGTTPYVWTATGLPSGLAINPSTGLISGTPTAAGTTAVKVTVTDANKLTATSSFSWITGIAPTLTNPKTQASVIGIAAGLSMAATGGTTPYTWTATDLPPGLAINASTGTISGTPTAAGTYLVKVTATTANRIAGSTAFTWRTGTKPAVTNLGNRITPTGAEATIAASGAGGTTPYAWTASGLPAGVTINALSGIISGTPTASGTANVTVTLTDALGFSAAATFTWTTGATPAITDPGAQAPTTGTTVSRSVTATGGSAPYKWSATGLPPGLAINASTGTVTGKPSTVGMYTSTISATDALGLTGKTAVTWSVAAALTWNTEGYPKAATALTPFSSSVLLSGGTAPYNWSASGLPVGLSIDSRNGVISGTPADVAQDLAYYYTDIAVVDAAGRSTTAQVLITVTRQVVLRNAGETFAVDAVIPDGYLIKVLDRSVGNAVVATCTQTPCNTAITQKVAPGVHTYVAQIISLDGASVLHTSLEKSVTWNAYAPTTVPAGQSGEVTHWIIYPSSESNASVTFVTRAWDSVTTSPFYLEISNKSSGTVLASCATGYECRATIPESMRLDTITYGLAKYTVYPTTGRTGAGITAPPMSFNKWTVSLTPGNIKTDGSLGVTLSTNRYLEGPIGRFGPSYDSKKRGMLVLINHTSGVVRKCPEYLSETFGYVLDEFREPQWICRLAIPATELKDHFQAAVMSPYRGCFPVYREYYDCREVQAASSLEDSAPTHTVTPYLIADAEFVSHPELVTEELKTYGTLDRLGVKPATPGKPSEVVRNSTLAVTTTAALPDDPASQGIRRSYLVDSNRFPRGSKPDDIYQYGTFTECGDHIPEASENGGWVKNRYSLCMMAVGAGATKVCIFRERICVEDGYFNSLITMMGRGKIGAYETTDDVRWAEFETTVNVIEATGTFADDSAFLSVEIDCFGSYDDLNLHPNGKACAPGSRGYVNRRLTSWVQDEHSATLDLISEAEVPNSSWGDQLAHGLFNFDFKISLPRVNKSWDASSQNATVRFDSAYYLNLAESELLGSVFDRATPGFNYSLSDAAVKGVAEHLQMAQTLPQWTYPRIDGKQLEGATANDPLHRLAKAKGQPQSERNAENERIRSNYCGRVEMQTLRQYLLAANPTTTYQCDEYPMRSTYEGAGRSTYDPSIPEGTYSVEWVPGPENHEAGIRLGAWYEYDRILDNDPFFMAITS